MTEETVIALIWMVISTDVFIALAGGGFFAFFLMITNAFVRVRQENSFKFAVKKYDLDSKEQEFKQTKMLSYAMLIAIVRINTQISTSMYFTIWLIGSILVALLLK